MRRLIPVILMVTVSCGGGGGGATAPTPALRVAGNYDVVKTLVSDTCGGIPAQVSNPATVQHTPGASTFVLTDHGTRDLPGTVDAGGAFQIPAVTAIVHGSIPAVDTFEGGRFTTQDFSVRSTTDLQASAEGPACRMVLQWEGRKLGDPNVIP
jgi:hypothetical protein